MKQRRPRVRRPDGRVVLVATFIVVAAVILILAKTPVRGIDVDAELAAHEFSVELAERWTLEDVTASELTLAQASPLSIVDDSAATISLRPRNRFWSVSLKGALTSQVYIEKGSHVRVAALGSDVHGIRLELLRGTMRGAVVIDGPVEISCNNCEVDSPQRATTTLMPTQWNLEARRREIAFEDRDGRLTVGMATTLPADQPGRLLNEVNIPIRAIDFTREEGDERASTIANDGELRFAGLPAFPVKVIAGDFVLTERVESASYRIRHIASGPTLKVRLQGRLSEVMTGAPPESRLPSYLRVASESREWQLITGAVAAVMSVFLAVAYRLRLMPEK